MSHFSENSTIHVGKEYDVEIDSSTKSPEECAQELMETIDFSWQVLQTYGGFVSVLTNCYKKVERELIPKYTHYLSYLSFLQALL